MADRKRKDPKRKKRQETPQEHVKRQQAAGRRIRHKGQFAPGVHKAHAVFHHTAMMMKGGHKQTWKDENFPPSSGDQMGIFSTTEYSKRQEPKTSPAGKATHTKKPTLTSPKDTQKSKTNKNAPRVFPVSEEDAGNYKTLDEIVRMDTPNVSGSVPGHSWPSDSGDDVNIGELHRNEAADGPDRKDAKVWQGNARRDSQTPTPDSPEVTYRLIHESIKSAYESKLGTKEADRLAHQHAELKTAAMHGYTPSSSHMREQMKGISIRQETGDELYSRGKGGDRRDADTGDMLPPGRVSQERLWITHRGTFHSGRSPEGPLQYSPRHVDEQNIYKRLPNEQQAFVQQNFDGNPGDRQKYLQLVSEGYSSREVLDWLDSGAPMSKAPKGPYKKGTQDSMEAYMGMAHEDIDNRRTANKGGMKDKYDLGYSHDNFSHSMQAPGTDSLETLRKRFPQMPEQELVKYAHAQRMAVNEYMLEQNERWAHETRAARVKGVGKGDNNEKNDRIVFFTTNLGGPNASVGSDSLVGQYIIRKRKAMVVNDRQASRKEVKGEFPRAVRDQHLIELSTGMSLGVRGQYGLFHNTGWKAGTKKSKGYGKHSAVGATALRDSTGQPIYDKEGNVRYTEGYTRMFDAGTNRDVGLRIFIG